MNRRIIRQYRIKHCVPGFTLAEILVAMLISSILVLGINTAYRQARLVVSHVEDQLPIYRDGRMITELLRNELSGIYLPPASPSPAEQGEEQQQSENFNLLSLPDGASGLEFYTLTPSYRSHWGASRPAKVNYKFSEGELIRTEAAYSGEKKLGPQYTNILGTNLTAVTFGAYDGNARQWQVAYRSSQAPPKAVKVVLEAIIHKNIPKTKFSTTIFIPIQAALEQEK